MCQEAKRSAATTVPEVELTAEQEDEVARVMDVVAARMTSEMRQMVRMMATKSLGGLFGPMEFQLRDVVHRLGALTLQTVLDERKKGGTWGPAPSARIVKKTRRSKAIAKAG